MTAVYYLMKKNITAELSHKLCGMIPEEEMSEILIRPDTPSRTDTLLGRGLLRAALSKEFGIPSAGTVIGKSPSGKPYLRYHENVHFSISHTVTCVACAVSDHPIGIDAETVTSKDHGRITQRYFTAGEQDYVSDDPVRFYDVWTRKESLGKMMGTGVTRSLMETDVFSGDLVFIPVNIPDTAACICMEIEDHVTIHELSETELQRNL